MNKSNWRMVRFGDVVRNVNETVNDPLKVGLERYIGLDHLDPESLHIKRWGLIEEGTTFTRRVRPGQVLFGKRRAYQRKAAVASFDAVCSGDILVFEPRNEELLLELLPFIVQSDGFFDHALSTSAGSLSPRTSWSDLAAYEFALPPQDEQRRIAELLWAADAMYLAKQRVFSCVKALRQILIDSLFSVESNMQQASLQEVCVMQNGRSFPSAEYQDKGIRLLRPGNLGINGYFDWSEDVTVYLPEKYTQKYADYIINASDVVINLTAQSLEDGFMGRVCYALENDISLLNQRIGRFICNDNILPEYLFRSLQTTAFRKHAESNSEGSKIRHLYWRHLANYSIRRLSHSEQKELVETTNILESCLQQVDTDLKTSFALYQTLLKTLLNEHRTVVNVQ